MLIREIMNTAVCQCTEDTRLADVYELIQTCPHRYAVVIDSNQHRVPLGIVNEHSICRTLIGEGRGKRELVAGSLMDTRIQKVPDVTEVTQCAHLLSSDAAAIVVVGRRREFLGVVDTVELERSIARESRNVKAAPLFSGLIGQAIPASVEIPAFGWLK